MNFIADLHTHTVASTHAYSTWEEMIRAAKEKGLWALAVTDHGYAMPGAPGTWYFENLRVIPRIYQGVLVLRGQESNVLDAEGTLDLLPRDAECLDWIVASMHGPTMGPGPHKEQDITRAWLRVAENPVVRVIGHCGGADFPFDYKRVIPVVGEAGKLVELNEATFRMRPRSIPNCVEIMKLCKQYKVPIVVNSDAHFSASVGVFPESISMLSELDFPRELVINSSRERLEEYLLKYTKLAGEIGKI